VSFTPALATTAVAAAVAVVAATGAVTGLAPAAASPANAANTASAMSPASATSPADAASTASATPATRSAPAAPAAPAAPVAGPDHLTVTVRDAGPGKDGTWELYCHPEGGTHPATADACARLERVTADGGNPFAPPGKGADTLCTFQYGGPATARITGRWGGRAVDATFDRGDGCRIGRWNALVPVLPALTNADRWA
jgi:hypothetical protein